MERYLKIAKVNLKFNLFPHIVIAFALCLISPLIMGVRNLDAINTTKILNMYISLLGIVILVPLFMPDSDINIRDLVRTKKEYIIKIYLVRITQALLFLALIVGGYLLYLKNGNCKFDYLEFYYGTLANCIFLGGVGIVAYAIVDNVAVGYMLPLLYYSLCYGAGKDYLGKFYLFSAMKGNIEDKIYLLIAGIVMIIIGIVYRVFSKSNKS